MGRQLKEKIGKQEQKRESVKERNLSETCGEVKSANGWDNAADTVLELHTHNVCVFKWILIRK